MTETIEPTQTITFKREGGNLVRVVVQENVPFLLRQGEEPLAYIRDVATQVFDAAGEKRYRAFLAGKIKEMNTNIKNGNAELKTLKHLGHDELTNESIHAFIETIKKLPSNNRKIKFTVENMEKLCQVVFKKISLKHELNDIGTRLKMANEEQAELDKFDATEKK